MLDKRAGILPTSEENDGARIIATDEPGDIWEINRCGTMRAEIRHFMPVSAQEIDHWASEWKAGVIATNGEFHCSL